MKITIYSKGAYEVLSIEEELSVISDLQELKYLVDGYLRQGKNHIALRFPGTSYIYSGAIAILLHCLKEIRDENGVLCIIEPNPNIHNILDTLNVTRLIRIALSEDELMMPEGKK